MTESESKPSPSPARNRTRYRVPSPSPGKLAQKYIKKHQEESEAYFKSIASNFSPKLYVLRVVYAVFSMDHVGFLSASALSVLIEVLQAVVTSSTIRSFYLRAQVLFEARHGNDARICVY